MRKTAAAIIVLSLMAIHAAPVPSQASTAPYFIAVNDTLLPFDDGGALQIRGGEFYVPRGLFRNLGLWSFANAEREHARIYNADRHIDFYTLDGLTMDIYGNFLNWPPPYRAGSVFYVPLRHVCDYFGLSLEIISISRDIIPEQQMQLIRITAGNMHTQDSNAFVMANRDALRNAYYSHFSSQPGDTTRPPADPEPPPTYSDVTIYLSFHNLDAGNLGMILDALSHPDARGYRAAFFVSADEISGHAGLIRRIAGSGHAIGIWLEEGTAGEYLDASTLLFEAAKVRTVLVSADTYSWDLDTAGAAAETTIETTAETAAEAAIKAAAETAMETARSLGLVFRGITRMFEPNTGDTGGTSGGMAGNLSGSAYAEIFPTESGSRHNIGFDCTDETASLLPDVLAFLSAHEYAAGRVSETAGAG